MTVVVLLRLWGRVRTKTIWGISLCLILTWFMGISLSRSQSPKSQPKYTIAFGSAAPYDTDIFIADEDGSNAKPLAPDPALDYNASFSYDGQWIVFTSHRTGPAGIYRIHPDGTGLEKLTDDRAFDDQAALSPDGKSLAYVSSRSGQADIWTMNLETRTIKNITNNPAGDFRPSWSPDGQWIAFSSDRDSPRKPCPDDTPFGGASFVQLQFTSVYIVHPDGSGLRRLTDATRVAGTPHWSPDSSHLVFYDADVGEKCGLELMQGNGTMQIISLDLKTGERKTLTSGSGEKVFPHWLNDGRISYAVIGEQPGLFFTTKGTGIVGEFGAPDWLPALHKMVFHREVGQPYNTLTNPGVQEWYSPDPRFKLVRTKFANGSYSPHGDRMVFTVFAPGTALVQEGLGVSNADGSKGRIIFQDPQKRGMGGLAWSPLGDWITFGWGAMFQYADSKPAQLMLIRPDGTELKAVTKADQNSAMPSWSPDGKFIAYRFARGTQRGLAILDLATGSSRILETGSDRDTFPSWSPRGDWITFTSHRDGDYEIYIILPDGTGLKRLTWSPGNDAHPSFSPDGEWIAFATARGGFKDEALLQLWNFQPYGEIVVMRPDGSDVHVLTDNATEEGAPNWIPTPAGIRNTR